MPGSYYRSPSQSTTHGSYVHDSDQDAHDYTRLRLQQQLAKDLLEQSSFVTGHENTETMDIMGDAAAMSTRRLDDILPSTPNLDSKYINAQFKDFSTVGVGVRTRLFPHLSNNPDSESLEIGRAGDENTKTDRSTTSILPRSRLNVPGAGQPRRHGLSPNTRARLQPSVADESVEMGTRPLNHHASRLQGGAKRSKDDMKSTREQLAKEHSLLRANSSTPPLPKPQVRAASAFLNTEKLFRDMGFDDSVLSEPNPGSPSFRARRIRAASKPQVPSHGTMNSIKLPDMTGISSLVSGTHPGDSTVAAKHNKHVPIESIPVPQGERDLMVALKKLQEKVAALESDKAQEKKKAAQLEKDYEETRQLYQIEYNGRRELEAELNTRKRADSALGGEISSQDGSPRGGNDREKLKAQHKAEIKKLDSVVAAYRHRLTSLEASQVTLKEDITKATEEKNAAITSLAHCLADSEALKHENEALRQENEELRVENETFANEIESMNAMMDDFKKALDNERKLMGDKINRYREKVARAGKVATEATLGANEAMRLFRDMKKNSLKLAALTAVENVKPTGRENEPETFKRHPQSSQTVKPATKAPKPKDYREEVTPTAEARVQQQVDAELRKMFTQTSSAPKPKTAPTSRTSVRPHVKKTRTIVEEYSESESDIAIEEQQEQIPVPAETSLVQPHMDTTFTEPSIAGSRVRRESDGDVLPDDTLHSFLTSEGMAALRREIRNERRAFQEGLALQRELEESEARKAQVLAERIARRNTEEEASKKRVFIYSEKDNETTVTEQDEDEDEDETPHPNLRTSMIVNDPAEDANPVDILPSALRTTITETEPRHRRTTQDFYNNHVQEVIDQLGVHKPDLCTICHRKNGIEECHTNGHSGNIINETLVEIPEVIPVSKRMPEVDEEAAVEADMTIRPSQPPKYALDKVVKQMEDELEHMRLEYKKLEEEFLACDPSLGRRKRKSLTHALNEMVEQMDKKSDQIYALYDVAEMVHIDFDGEQPRAPTARSHSRRSSKRRDGRTVMV